MGRRLLLLMLIVAVSSCATHPERVSQDTAKAENQRMGKIEKIMGKYFEYCHKEYGFKELVAILVKGDDRDQATAFWSLETRLDTNIDEITFNDILFLTRSILKARDISTRQLIMRLLSSYAFSEKLALAVIIAFAEIETELRETSRQCLSNNPKGRVPRACPWVNA
jgi:hypothetical protein